MISAHLYPYEQCSEIDFIEKKNSEITTIKKKRNKLVVIAYSVSSAYNLIIDRHRIQR